jgi:hypothetical protein
MNKMKLVRIWVHTNPDPRKIIDLKDILPECHRYANRKWVAWEVECSGTDWYSTFNDAPNEQIELTFKMVEEYAKDTCQTIWGFFFAVKPEITRVPLLKTPGECLNYSDLIIRAFDGTFFIVATGDAHLIDRLVKKFKKVSVEDLNPRLG